MKKILFQIVIPVVISVLIIGLAAIPFGVYDQRPAEPIVPVGGIGGGGGISPATLLTATITSVGSNTIVRGYTDTYDFTWGGTSGASASADFFIDVSADTSYFSGTVSVSDALKVGGTDVLTSVGEADGIYSSDSLDFDEFLDAMTIDDATSIDASSNTLSIIGTLYGDTVSISDALTVGGSSVLTSMAVTAPLWWDGTTLDIDLASTSGGGYLSSSDWDTFNAKQGAISVTAPLHLSGTTLDIDLASTSGGGYLSSTDWDTFNAKQATISIVGDPLSFGGTVLDIDLASTSGSGYLSNTDWDTFNAKLGAGAVVTHDLLNADFHTDVTNASASRGDLIVSDGADSWAAFTIGASSSFLMNDGTDIVWDELDGSFVDISDNTNLVAGTNITLSGDTLNVDDMFLLHAGDTATGVHDFGGATSFEIPNAAAPTVDAMGEIALDSTGEAIRFYGTETHDLVATLSFGFTLGEDHLASSSWQVEKQFAEPITITKIACRAKSGTSFGLDLQECDASGANCSDVDALITCGATVTYDDGSLTNPTIDALDTVVASTSEGDISGAVETGRVDIFYKWTAE